MRLQEVHPSIVHFPIALLPVALGSDALGALVKSDALLGAGRRLMPVAAISAVFAAATGLVAQEAVKAEGRAHDLLVTHRNLNAGVVGLVATLAFVRSKASRPSFGYQAAGMLSLAGMTYTAYLGGRMVYGHGLGVEPAGGVRVGHAPPLRAARAGEVLGQAMDHLVHGARHALEHARQGELAPALGSASREHSDRAEPERED